MYSQINETKESSFRIKGCICFTLISVINICMYETKIKTFLLQMYRIQVLTNSELTVGDYFKWSNKIVIVFIMVSSFLFTAG